MLRFQDAFSGAEYPRHMWGSVRKADVWTAAALLAPLLVSADDDWMVKADWNTLGTTGTKHDNVHDLAACLSKASGHALFSYAKDSSRCYVSDGHDWGGHSASHVTSGCIAAKVHSCPTTSWTVHRDWNSGGHGSKTTEPDMEACISKAQHHAQFAYAQDSSHCYVWDGTTFGGHQDTHVTSGCMQAKVKGCGPAPKPHQHHPAPAHHKHHPHHPEPACASWPTFASAAALQASPWGGYFSDLYGSLPPADHFPLNVGSWWVLWDDLLSKHKVPLPHAAGKCAPPNCQLSLFTENNAYSPPKTQWIWHPPPYQPSDYAPPGGGDPWTGWVEVMHKKDPFGDEHHGAWFLYAKGSNVWYNTGKFIEFEEHADAYKHFGAQGNEAVCQAAAANGYDTIIFLAHHDSVNYPCAQAANYPYMNVEIVAVKLQGTYSCGVSPKTPGVLRSGWGGSAPCPCDDNFKQSNCGRHLWSLSSEGEAETSADALLESMYTGNTMAADSVAPNFTAAWLDASAHRAHAPDTIITAAEVQVAPSSDCTQNHSSAVDPPWFATCKTEGACLRIAVKSSTLTMLNVTGGFGRGFLWCIDHLNQMIYTKMNATCQPAQAPYHASFFEVDYPERPGRQANQPASCRLLASHWASGNMVRVFQVDMLNCTSEYVPSQLPGPDGVTSAILTVE